MRLPWRRVAIVAVVVAIAAATGPAPALAQDIERLHQEFPKADFDTGSVPLKLVR